MMIFAFLLRNWRFSLIGGAILAIMAFFWISVERSRKAGEAAAIERIREANQGAANKADAIERAYRACPDGAWNMERMRCGQ